MNREVDRSKHRALNVILLDLQRLRSPSMPRRSSRARKRPISLAAELAQSAENVQERRGNARIRRKPAEPSGSNSISQPSDIDVLLGRGRKVESHPGNKAFHKRIDDCLAAYMPLTTRGEKYTFTMNVVHSMKREGIRFIGRKGDSYPWEEVKDEIARIKVGQQLRYRQRQYASPHSN